MMVQAIRCMISPFFIGFFEHDSCFIPCPWIIISFLVNSTGTKSLDLVRRARRKRDRKQRNSVRSVWAHLWIARFSEGTLQLVAQLHIEMVSFHHLFLPIEAQTYAF